MITLDQLTGIIVSVERLDVEFKSDRRTMACYCLPDDEIAVVEGSNEKKQNPLCRIEGSVAGRYLGAGFEITINHQKSC